MLGGTLGGGHWTCDKCGRSISGSSINHECDRREYRKIKIARIFLSI